MYEKRRKQVVRRTALTRRARLTERERDDAAGRIAERALELPELAGASSVLGYASFGSEVPTDPLLGRLLGSGVRLLLPWVDGERLRAAEVGSLEELAPGFRGIREPSGRVPVDPDVDAVLVPGVAFDAAGRRLGYGGGFYDSLLRTLAPGVSRIGLCFEVQIVDEVPADPDDQPVDIVVTDARTLRR
jgi:5-formyltetrahydrofolate cyclo-ligase